MLDGNTLPTVPITTETGDLVKVAKNCLRSILSDYKNPDWLPIKTACNIVRDGVVYMTYSIVLPERIKCRHEYKEYEAMVLEPIYQEIFDAAVVTF